MDLDAIIFDLDGTVMPSGRYSMPSEYICEVVEHNKNKLKLCAATGRAWPEAKRVINKLGVNQLSIINGGAAIVDPVKEVAVWQETIPVEKARILLRIAKQYPYKVSYAQGLTVTDNISPNKLQVADSINTFYILDIPAAHSDLNKLISELSGISGITASKALAWSIENGVDIHITSNVATKEHAVVELCNILGVNRSNVAGVGDGHNDIHLFNSVGYKVAMGNAVKELKEASDEVIMSVEEDGLAQFIESAVAL